MPLAAEFKICIFTILQCKVITNPGYGVCNQLCQKSQFEVLYSQMLYYLRFKNIRYIQTAVLM